MTKLSSRSALEGIVADPDRSLSALPLLTEAERQRLLVEWNDTAVEYPKEKCVHELFAEQAARTPDAAAVVYENRYLTYGELDRRSNKLAHYLRGLGVGPEVAVGLCVERSLDLVIGALGILKAGGAYLPLDPSYPEERLAFMLADAKASALVTQARLVEQLPEQKARLVRLDADWPVIAREPSTAPITDVAPANLVYVMYTSGSTGKPKGVMLRHDGIVNRLSWMDGTYGMQPCDGVLQKTPFSFDVSVWEFFWPLTTGAVLIMAQPGGHRDGEYLVRMIVEHGITVLHFVPSMLRQFLQTKGVEKCTSLRDVMCSGEALSSDLVAEFANKVSARLHNLYGPTEASIDVSSWACDSSSPDVRIGRPIWNTQLYVLDESLEPVSIGLTGELYIGGGGLARGYIKRPALTADRFVPNPFTHGERLYRTGDLARWRADGELEFLGRIDHQVKIRGYRIELGEIEAALRGHPAVQSAVAIAVDRSPTDRVLVAYIVPRAGERALSAELNAFARETLPSYMVPCAFRTIDALPLGPSGKVDRRTLALMEVADPAHLENILGDLEQVPGEYAGSRLG